MNGMRVAGFPIVIAVGLSALPLVGLIAILLLRRSAKYRSLAGGILLAGVTASLLTACFGFSAMTVPIASHGRVDHPLLSLLGPIALFLYVGFGLGMAIAAVLGFPVAYLADRLRSIRGNSSGEAGSAG
jgi:hypothetical protein